MMYLFNKQTILYLLSIYYSVNTCWIFILFITALHLLYTLLNMFLKIFIMLSEPDFTSCKKILQPKYQYLLPSCTCITDFTSGIEKELVEFDTCVHLRNRFLSSCRNTSGSLGEREMLWEHKPTGEYFHRFFVFSQT